MSGAALKSHVDWAHSGQFDPACPACIELKGKIVAETAEAIVVASGSDASFDPAVCWLRGDFGTAPTSGSLTIGR